MAVGATPKAHRNFSTEKTRNFDCNRSQRSADEFGKLREIGVLASHSDGGAKQLAWAKVTKRLVQKHARPSLVSQRRIQSQSARNPNFPAAASFSQKNAAVGVLGCRWTVGHYLDCIHVGRSATRYWGDDDASSPISGIANGYRKTTDSGRSLQSHRFDDRFVGVGESFDEPLLDGKGHRDLPAFVVGNVVVDPANRYRRRSGWVLCGR